MNPVCLITGAGPGTGTALVARFAEGGYRVAMLARDEERLAQLSQRHDGAVAYPCDVSDNEALTSIYARIKDELGAPGIIVHNAVAAQPGVYTEVSAKRMRLAFEVNTIALLTLAQLATPDMLNTGGGAIIATGNTAAYRGRPRFAGFAPTKAAQRILLESIAREAGPKGIHAAYVAIDAVIDVPWTRQAYADRPDEFFCQPADIAEECFRIAHQPRSAWTFESVIRPFGETW
ncbi:MAG: SDR family NAD(P)-dependent oxidoreductase [Pseudomonadota bacterium]